MATQSTDPRSVIHAKIVELARDLGNDARSLRNDQVIPDTGLLDSPALLELILFYEQTFALDVDQIAEVDVVVGDDGLYATLAPHGGESGFDYAIASNIIEHTPDMIGWLGDIARLVHPGGRLLLVVPDKRYTFDYLRRLSSLTDLMDAWIRGNSKP